MVQRKVINKLGIHADTIKHENLLVSLKPNSLLYQDGKNRGADLKKKMKKSRSIRLSDIESLKSSALKKNKYQPGKPPPSHVPTTAVVPQKQPLIKSMDGSPNYMKSTSCYDAKKEQSQVSLRNSQASPHGKIPLRRNSKTSNHFSVSNGKLTRSSSLKLVRTLTKTSSFKLARASAKKSSRMALCADMNVEKATCSSTLKDSKFPSYLTLNPGGTDSEGTTAIKVCPYTYCSLNGHHHTPLPPLKNFLSARRRSLKTQKKMIAQALSPRKAKPSSIGVKVIDDFSGICDEGTATKDEALAHLAMPSSVKEEGVDFFIEIFTKSMEHGNEEIGITPEDDGKIVELFPSDGGVKEAALESHIEKQVVESLSDRSLHSEIDSEESMEGYSDTFLEEMKIKYNFCDDEQKDDVKYYPLVLAEKELTPGMISNVSDFERSASIGVDDTGSETTDMDWDEGQFSDAEVEDEANSSSEFGDEPKSTFEFSLEIECDHLSEESVIKADDIVCNCSDMIEVDKVQEEPYKEESACMEEEFDYDHIAQDYMQWNLEIQESKKMSDRSIDELSYIDNDSSTTEEDDERAEVNVIDISVTSSSIKKPLQEQDEKTKENSEETAEKNRDPESEIVNLAINPETIGTEFTIEMKNIKVDLVNPQDDGRSAGGGSQFSYEDEIYEGSNGSQKLESTDKDISVGIDYFFLDQEFTRFDSVDKLKYTEQNTDVKLLEQVQTSELSEAASEATGVNANKNHLPELYQVEENTDSSNSDHDVDDKTVSPDPQDNLSVGMNNSTDSDLVQNLFEEKQGEAEKSNANAYTGSEKDSDLRLNPSGLSQNDNSNADSMEVENDTKSDGSETLIKVDEINLQKKRTFLHAEDHGDQELPNTYNKWKGGMRYKRPINDMEEPKKFNPREPNYLLLVPDSEAEKIDLRHQMMDGKKNTEEWMIDHALQQAVSKLAPARKRKVALLVEAFETVIPIPKHESHQRHSSAAFSHTRTIQACN